MLVWPSQSITTRLIKFDPLRSRLSLWIISPSTIDWHYDQVVFLISFCKYTLPISPTFFFLLYTYTSSVVGSWKLLYHYLRILSTLLDEHRDFSPPILCFVLYYRNVPSFGASCDISTHLQCPHFRILGLCS